MGILDPNVKGEKSLAGRIPTQKPLRKGLQNAYLPKGVCEVLGKLQFLQQGHDIRPTGILYIRHSHAIQWHESDSPAFLLIQISYNPCRDVVIVHHNMIQTARQEIHTHEKKAMQTLGAGIMAVNTEHDFPECTIAIFLTPPCRALFELLCFFRGWIFNYPLFLGFGFHGFTVLLHSVVCNFSFP